MTLTEFLRARLDEDERHARKLAESDRRPVLSLATTVNHPERLLLEVEAKRRIVALADWEGVKDSLRDRIFGPSADQGFRAGIESAMRALALPYADHDDYDESWRP